MNKRVLVFKTSVNENGEVEKLRPALNGMVSQNEKWNFDLEDCDNILRVESPEIKAEHIRELLSLNGFDCRELPD